MKCSMCGKVIKEENYTKDQWNKKIKRYERTNKIYCCLNCAKESSKIFLIERNKTVRRQEMIENNPSKDPLIREKISKRLKEIKHKPVKRGGNGQGLTVPQELLLNTLEQEGAYVIPEYVVLTKMKRGSGYPTCYKIDLAIVDKKIAIEIDGNSHCSILRQEQDLKKSLFLENLGWKVYHFKNKYVMENSKKIVQELLSTI